MFTLRLLVVAAALAAGLAADTLHAQQNVSLELVTEPGFPVSGQQRWLAALKDLDVGNLRIRQGQGRERPEVRQSGSGRSAAYTLVGVLTAEGKIVLPGRSFGLDEKGAIQAYLGKVSSGKANEPEEERVAFGLTPEQLVATHEALAGKVTFSTKGKPVGDVSRQIVKALGFPIAIDADARQAVDAGELVHDELQGLSHGTALAASLRPAGLVFAPLRTGSEIRLRIADSRTLEESWPIGWPSQKGMTQTLPKMGNYLNVNITDTPLSEVIASVQGRVGAPFLMDHNGLALERIDPAKIKVSVPEGRTYYKRILDVALSKGRLRSELRVDEADTPFVWISTTKQR